MDVDSVQVPTVVEPTFRLTDSVPAVPLARTTMVLLPPPEELLDEPVDELLEELLDELLEEELLDELEEELPPPFVAPGMLNQLIWAFEALTLT